MSDKVSLVRVLTAATGNSTPITLGARYSDLFMTPADAGAVDGRTYTWLIVDGNNWELVKGVYTASGATAARTTVLASRSAGTLGTSRIVLSGTAQVRIVESSYDTDGVRGTRSVAGTSDTLASTDLGYVVTYGNAAAVAVSLAQAGTASLYDGWATWVQNTGVGTVTITPATSTVNGNASLPLATNMGAFIWSDGTNYHAHFVPVSKPLLAANNLADVASASTALGNLSGVSFAPQTLTASQQDQVQKNAGIPAIMRSYLAGLTLSTAGSSATFTVTPGVATDSTNTDMIGQASGFNKTTAAWAAGSGAIGSLDTGTIANNTWYHVFIIKRPDTGAVDYLISLSATAPTLPTNYTLFRRIGSMRTNGSAQWILFNQMGDEFLWSVALADATTSGTAYSTTPTLQTLTVPTGIQMMARTRFITASVNGFLINSPDESSVAFSSPVGNQTVGTHASEVPLDVHTNTSAQIRIVAGAAASTGFVTTYGWIDTRGKNN